MKLTRVGEGRKRERRKRGKGGEGGGRDDGEE
jgi:hypothetical protein